MAAHRQSAIGAGPTQPHPLRPRDDRADDRRRRRLLAAHRRRAAHPRRRRRGDRRQHRPRPAPRSPTPSATRSPAAPTSSRSGRRRTASACTTSSSSAGCPPGMGHVFFTSGGSESADSAIRLARAYHLAVRAAGALEGRRPPPELPRPDARRPRRRQPPTTGAPASSRCCSTSRTCRGTTPPRSRRSIEQEGPTRSPAFLFEPITGAAGGCLEPSDDYWRRVTDVCRRHDILLIADEVMTGFGRTGTRWGHEHFPLRPDVIYGGKGLGGGYVPMGMVAATDDVVDALRGSGVHVLHVHRQRRDVRRRRHRARHPRARAPRRALRGDGRRPRRPPPGPPRRPPPVSTSAAAGCSAASSSSPTARLGSRSLRRAR